MKTVAVEGFVLQAKPVVLVASLDGRWLVKHSTTSWRLKDREKGFQRIVREDRCRAMARDVLDQGRSFPNAIVLATDVSSFEVRNGRLVIPETTLFLVVDGQHRLWAQKFSGRGAAYACAIHLGLGEADMARLFLEINDNQRRVPSSLRWDLVRLVRPDDDPGQLLAADVVYALATDDKSPLFQRIDLTGEQPELRLKQGSIAPEIRALVTAKNSALRKVPPEVQYEVFVQYLAALPLVDPDGWHDGTSVFFRARVLRAVLRLLNDLLAATAKSVESVRATDFLQPLKKIDRSKLADEELRAIQGAAGIAEIYKQIRSQAVG
jgi:DNA sulfur modification protein DndB